MKNQRASSISPCRTRHFLALVSMAVICCALALVVPSSHSQTSNERKLLVRVQPTYPEYLRVHEIGGSVRLLVEILPSGKVKSVSPVGGNPILVQAAMDAVKQWKYAPGDTATTTEVKIDFVPPKE